MLDAMEERSSYLNALNKGSTMEVSVTMLETDIEDFSLLSDAELTATAEALSSAYEGSGITVI